MSVVHSSFDSALLFEVFMFCFCDDSFFRGTGKPCMDALKKRQRQPELRKMKAVVFDFDGTLAVLNIDFSVMKERVFDVMRGLGVDEGSLRETYLLEIIDEVTQYLRENKPAAADRFYEEAHCILQSVEMEAAEEGRLLPGVTATLERLRRRGFKVGIVTRNCEDAVKRVFPKINHFCDVFVSRNSTRKVKPHPDHLTYTMNALGVRGEEAVMVGDHTLDIQAGKTVGMMTVGVLTGRITRAEFERAGADTVLLNATEICALLEG
jgi:phosphoglycolate phosphatase